MRTLLCSPPDERAHGVEIAGGPESVRSALTAALVHVFGYRSAEATAQPIIHIVVDAEDERPDAVVMQYVQRALEGNRSPIPLFLTARARKFRRRGLAWEDEFLFPAGEVRLDQLVARMRVLALMWGADFPVDIVRDAVVGSFRMMMELDADDYHHRSDLVEDLQRIAEWDAQGTPPALRAAQQGSWQPPLPRDHAYARLFATAYREIDIDMRLMLNLRDQTHDPSSPNRVRDLANNILRKIPSVNGRFVHALRDIRPHVLIIDDEADRIVATLKKQRIGYERDAAVLDDVFRLGAEALKLGSKPALPEFFDPERWIRCRTTGEVRPGGLIDLRCADLLLLDLSLDQGPDSELAGFVLLEKLRTAIPDVPVVIHTGSAELGHIIQAIRNGADWYVRKDAARAYSDLASILNDIGRRPEWHKSAPRLGQERTIADVQDLKSELRHREVQYVWRALAVGLPKGELRVTHFSSGVSGALTCGIDILPPRNEKATAERYPLTSFVAKIDRPYVIISERERFRNLVAPRIGNRAGRIDSDVVHAGPNVAGIAYTFSGIHQGQKRSSRTSLLPLFSFLDRALDSSRARFTDVAPLFEELFHGLLPALHHAKPEGVRSDWMEPLFGETRTLRDSHELRLPPRIDIDVDAFSDALPDHGSMELGASVGAPIHLPLCRIQKASEREISVLFTNEASGRTHRAKLTGEIAHFLAQFRNLRPNRAFSITGKVVRTRQMYYDVVARELADDLEWLQKAQLPDPFQKVEAALQVFEQLDDEVIGIVHGDLNLDNILVDVDANNLPVRGALWLIDFARTRRDSLAHDFVEMEVDLVARLLAASSGMPSTATIMEFYRSLDAGPLYARRHFDTAASFVNEACHFIRRAAALANVSRSEYLATLVIYYLIVLKLNHPNRVSSRRADSGMQIRRWSLVGASAALDALGVGPDINVNSDARLHVSGGQVERPTLVSVPRVRVERSFT